MRASELVDLLCPVARINNASGQARESGERIRASKGLTTHMLVLPNIVESEKLSVPQSLLAMSGHACFVFSIQATVPRKSNYHKHTRRIGLNQPRIDARSWLGLIRLKSR